MGQEEVPGHVEAGGDGRAEQEGGGLEQGGAEAASINLRKNLDGTAIVIVIVDTNLARNENSYSELLGNRKQLQAIAASNELYIPEVVIDEIVHRNVCLF